jgi:hypothetical protein
MPNPIKYTNRYTTQFYQHQNFAIGATVYIRVVLLNL